ncbi:NBR1-Ig-like domain-containing protein [Actinoplanes sp. NBRC 103695]|uniref:NBR1-Ig-like domain-containing protein n=1 Tax=Actinoplanes sp. NBRC 103695 TaxID=3032202 RepID=UPI0025528B6E|nr:NBR1-Ig-like domain-containing protein [Actinoplanes sp. NBRC 103695]
MPDRPQWINLGAMMRTARVSSQDESGRPTWPISRLVAELARDPPGAELARLQAAGITLRPWRRSALYSAESGEIPSRELVELYDALFDDRAGTLVIVYENAKAVLPPRHRPSRDDHGYPLAGDASEFVCDVTVPDGLAVPPGARLRKVWRFRNAGTVPWIGRRLAHIGAISHFAMPTAPRFVPVADTLPGRCVDVAVELVGPPMPGAFITYWKFVDDDGHPYFPQYPLGVNCLFRTVEGIPMPDLRIPNVRLSPEPDRAPHSRA